MHALFDISEAYFEFNVGNNFYNLIDTSILLVYLGHINIYENTFNNITINAPLFKVIESNLSIESSDISEISNVDGSSFTIINLYLDSNLILTGVNISD